MNLIITSKDRTKFKKNGFFILKKFFSTAQITKFRLDALNYFNQQDNHFVYHNCGKIVPNAFEYIPQIREVMNPDLIRIVKDLIGEVKYVFHSDLHYNMFNNWHRDLSSNYIDGFDNEDIFNKARIYKIGIYLQDHSNNNQGLSLIPSSHNTFNEGDFLEPITIHSTVGDVVIFDQRIMHKGFYLNEDEKNICRTIEDTKQNIDENKFNYFQNKRKIDNSTKMSIFYGVAFDDAISKEFATKTLQRQNKQNNVTNYTLSDSLRNYLQSINLEPIELNDE